MNIVVWIDDGWFLRKLWSHNIQLNVLFLLVLIFQLLLFSLEVFELQEFLDLLLEVFTILAGRRNLLWLRFQVLRGLAVEVFWMIEIVFFGYKWIVQWSWWQFLVKRLIILASNDEGDTRLEQLVVLLTSAMDQLEESVMQTILAIIEYFVIALQIFICVDGVVHLEADLQIEADELVFAWELVLGVWEVIIQLFCSVFTERDQVVFYLRN